MHQCFNHWPTGVTLKEIMGTPSVAEGIYTSEIALLMKPERRIVRGV